MIAEHGERGAEEPRHPRGDGRAELEARVSQDDPAALRTIPAGLLPEDLHHHREDGQDAGRRGEECRQGQDQDLAPDGGAHGPHPLSAPLSSAYGDPGDCTGPVSGFQ
jgi:hypothetical protein